MPGIKTSQNGTITMLDNTFANSIVIEGTVDDGETYDLWLRGRVFKRFRAGAVRRVRAGLAASRGFIELDGSEVSQ